MNRQTVCSTDLVIHTFPEKRKKKELPGSFTNLGEGENVPYFNVHKRKLDHSTLPAVRDHCRTRK